MAEEVRGAVKDIAETPLRIGKTEGGSRILAAMSTAPWTRRHNFAFRWAVLFFRDWLLSAVNLLLPSSVSLLFYDWSRPLRVSTIPNWFEAFWPPCPGCQYNPMFWQADPPWAALIALVGALIWRALDRDRIDYRRLFLFWHTAMRYSLGVSLIGWGVGKLAAGQFWGLHADAFLIARPLGEWSSRALMWNTMGQSVTYGMFTGVGEFLAGCLLFFRGTTLLGAILAFCITFIIFLLDALMNRGGVTGSALWCSFLALALILPEWKRIIAFYVKNRPIPPLKRPPAIEGRLRPLLKAVLLIYFGGGHAGVQYLLGEIVASGWAKSEWRTAPHPMTGVYEVTRMTRNGLPVVPVHNDTTQWAYVGFGGKGAQSTNMRGGIEPPTGMFIIPPDGAIHEGYAFALDSANQTMIVDTAVRAKSLQGMQFDTWAGDVEEPFTYEWIDIDRLIVRATISGDTIEVHLKRHQVHETTLFGSPRLIRNYYGSPIRWTRDDTLRAEGR